MTVKIGQKIKFEGKSWVVRKIEGDFIVLKCPSGCPMTKRVHKDQL
jgi:hypothetical protein